MVKTLTSHLRSSINFIQNFFFQFLLFKMHAHFIDQKLQSKDYTNVDL